MATPGVNDLDGLLASLNQLKPPGASKNKIATITTLCVNNIQAESTIVQSFYRALKKAPATHKLGALYVIDSVVRQWIEKAKSLGQELQFEGRGESGTYPAAVKRVTELMPALFDDIMKGLPADQKPKLENMITIWERGSTFPVKLLQDFKAKLGCAPAVNGSTATTTAPAQAPVKTSGEKFMAPIPSRPVQTPVGYPPQYLYDQGLLPGKAAPQHRDQRGGRGRYRQRSPIRNSPGPGSFGGRPMQPKYIAYDNTLPPDHIKVLSRTLFVGGANGTQQEIQELFERFGRVQTCIANRDKRHAFVKMTTRQYALAAKQGMEDLQNRNDRETMNIARQTKWGVGFGPRECCDYQRGESTIPIHKLTEADMKWLLTAEYGGTGGKQVEGGMVLEEPDIEIGAGVSSKAMSKRVGPENNPQPKKQKEDRGGRHGRNKGGDRDQGYGGYSGVTGGPPAMDYGYARPEPVAVATPPAVPGFGFSLLPPGSGQTFR
ncbi:uncharacterized protein MYCFIDRAFT_161926 [Pseudocercospora fijiensis CIRAD86]|uniref:CID domain-containing protein n=1 Tax=Pseudocercospora fijiensis (strain CIRAD86) TaxID=383855 RepID=M2Z949_PSEFD|nr:uncharacterized protein MYCFIDRAFT_161926 [Pseudocercospora fijiensis CIRAD86]EME86305.1 hypothetical protein MYCFIDRAFT_161926 [Pseudocercospora fijiensis CIRAD86]